MNPRIVTTIVGVITLILGALALFYPALVMEHLLGYAVLDSYPANFVYGEVRAIYGGVFIVIGVATVLAAMDPAANRGRILFIGMIFLGMSAGRLFGVFADGTPGWWGWLSALLEAATGGALVAISQMVPAPAQRPSVTFGTAAAETPVQPVPSPIEKPAAPTL